MVQFEVFFANLYLFAVCFLSLTKVLNLPGLANIPFLVIHSIAPFDSNSRISFSLSKVFGKLESVLSSGKL